jgi:spore coat protein H
MRLSAFVVSVLGLIAASNAQTWSLAGKVVDAEEGNGLGSVTVTLTGAGLKTLTAKNGTWTLAGAVGVERRAVAGPRGEGTLRVEDGRLLLRLGGRDILGRGFEAPRQAPGSVMAGRALATLDTLVYTRDGYVVKRVAVTATALTGILDSIRRIRYPGWVDSSHSNGFKPDTVDAFPDTLRKITFRFTKANWDHMMKVMADSCGKFGTSSGGFGGASKCQANQYDLVKSSALAWVPADMLTDGQIWKNVGIRLKGNASLQTAWSKGTYSLPFRINTDKYEDSLPETKNQRFQGFKKLSFFNLEQDSSGVRGAVASEIFRQSGVVAPYSVPTRLLLDRGDGVPLDVGIYEMLEIPDSPILNRHFANDSGNLYKPSSKLDQFVEAEWADEDLVTDFADAKALIAAINASNRASDPVAWRRNLEANLDVAGFLKWLAVSTAIMNWDAYGGLAHNYFLFNDRGVFRFITYDFGWSFDYQMATAGIVSRTSVWYDQAAGGFFNFGPYPLIDNLLADKLYCEEYRKHMVAAIAANGPAGVKSFQEKVDRFAKMVASQPSTVPAVQKLRTFMDTRVPEINASLNAKTCPIPL